MKNKELREITPNKKYILSLKFFTVFIAITILFSLSTAVFASSNFRVENCNKCEEYSQKLGQEINDFIELDVEPQKTVSNQVTSAINEYRKKLIDLQSHPDVEKRSLENEIVLAFTQANVAGRIAWVYYYNIYTFTSTVSSDKISAKYASYKNLISNSTQHTVLAAECDVMLDELNKLIYSERAKNLALPNDSLTSSSLISGKIEEFKTMYSADLFGKSYADAYKELTEELGLQRVRDALKIEAEKIFAKICPSQSFTSSPATSLLIYELKNAQSIKAMNNAAVEFIEELLEINQEKPYSSLVKAEYLSLSQKNSAIATENQTAAKFEDIFTTYSLAIKKAEIKDAIFAIIRGNGNVENPDLIVLEQKFNGIGGIIDNCSTDAEIEKELIQAKSELFLYKHKVILNKTFDELSANDEQITKDALIEYAELEEKVKQKLINDINIIAEKYNNILIKKITEYLPNDSLYLDLCEIISNEIKSTSRENIVAFYNKVSKIPKKAEAISKCIQEYRSILSSNNYKDYEQAEKDNLLSVLTELSKILKEIDPTDVAIYYDEINDAETNAIRKLNVIDQSARVRIETRFSKNPEVLNELNIAYQKISLCADKSEMILQANRAIYKIQRLLTSDAIISLCDKLKSSISAMSFLKTSEKDNFITSISALEIKSTEAKEAENLSALESIWISFSESLSNIQAEAEAIDLSRAINEYIEKISLTTDSHIQELNSFKYISKEKSDEIYNKIQSEQSYAKQTIPNCKATSEVLSEFAKFLDKLKDLLALANQEDLNGYKDFLLLQFDKYEKIKANYSAENYNKILAIKQSAIEKLSLSKSKSECDSILVNAHNEISLINNLLDDEKDSALTALLSLFESLKKESPLYSSQNFSKIEGLYDEAKIEVAKIDDIANIALVKQTLAKYLSLIKEVRKDTLYTSENAYNISTPLLQYPDDYDYSKGLLGSIHLSGGIVSDANFSINLIEKLKNTQISEMIRKSAKNGSLITSQKISDETLKLLRSSSVAATLDISLSDTVEGASGYTLKMLIPNDLAQENILGLAFVKGDQIEFYPISQADSLITAKLEHFSKYYIVVESTLNVKPLLIALIIFLSLEFLVLAGIVYLRYRRKHEKATTKKSDLPELPMSALIPTTSLLTKVYPENGIVLAILLSIAALALGSTIVLLLHKETKEKNIIKKEAQKQLKGKTETLLLGEGEKHFNSENAFFEDGANKEFCIVGTASRKKVSKAEIDLDIIAQNFKSGEIVNLQSLKNKGLINENTEYIKILSKGNLSKPLTIEANEFSNSARCVVELSGGEIKEIEQ